MRNLIYTCVLMSLLLNTQAIMAQVYEQSYLLGKMPEAPSKISGVTEEEKEAYLAKIDSLKSYFETLAKEFKHPSTTLEKSRQQDMFDWQEIFRELDELHTNVSINDPVILQIREQRTALFEEELDKRRAVSREMDKVQEKSGTLEQMNAEINRLDRKEYDIQCIYAQKNAELVTKEIQYVKKLIENFAQKTKKADTFLLADFPKGTFYPSLAVVNALFVLGYYGGYSGVFVPPFKTRWE